MENDEFCAIVDVGYRWKNAVERIGKTCYLFFFKLLQELVV